MNERQRQERRYPLETEEELVVIDGAPAADVSAAGPRSAFARPMRLAGRGKILVVDDESWVRTLLTDYFTEDGYSVRQASEAGQALMVVRQSHPDIVLLDVSLPGTSGLEVLKQIRQDDPRIAVILMTDDQDLLAAHSAIQLGAVDYTFKPFNLDRLDHAVRSSMNTLYLFDDRRRAEVEVAHVQGVTVVAPRGGLDAGASNHLKAILTDLVAGGVSDLVLDLAGVVYMDSAGLGALVSVLKQARALAGDVKLAAANDHMCTLLRMTGLANHIAAYSSREQAIAAFVDA